MDVSNDSNASSDSTLIWSPKTPPLPSTSAEDTTLNREMPTLRKMNTITPVDVELKEMPKLYPATQNHPTNSTPSETSLPMEIDNSKPTIETRIHPTTSKPSETSRSMEMDTSTPTREPPPQNQCNKGQSFRMEDDIRKEARAILKKVDATLFEQCNRLGNLLDSYNIVPTPPPLPVSTPPPISVPPSKPCLTTLTLVEIDLHECQPTSVSKLKRKLWLQNLVQLKESFGSEILFLNGKVDWKLTIQCAEEKKRLEKSSSQSTEEKKAPEAAQPIQDSPDSPEAPKLNLPKMSNLTQTSDETMVITPEVKTIESPTTIVKPVQALQETTDPRSIPNKEEVDKIKCNLGEDLLNQNSDITDSAESNVKTTVDTTTDCPQSSFKKDSRELKYKKSLPSATKRKNAADFFASDLDSSLGSSELDDSFSLEQEKPKEVYDQVSRGIKKLKLESMKGPEQRCSQSVSEQEKADVQYQLFLLNMESNADSLKKISNRKCKVCGEIDRNLKRHTIFEHVTDVWWGVIGDSTCWKCHAYHTLPDIRFCDGFYVPQRDLRSLVMRQREFFSYLKDDLECTSDTDLIGLVTREGLCNASLSPFTTAEINFLRDIDRVNGLSTNHLYNPTYPMRLTELLHWRTLGEIFHFAISEGVSPAIQSQSNHCVSWIVIVM